MITYQNKCNKLFGSDEFLSIDNLFKKIHSNKNKIESIKYKYSLTIPYVIEIK